MISPQLIALLEEHYPIGRVHTVSALSGGEWNQVFHLRCDRGVYVLRIRHPTTTAADLAHEFGVMGFMSQRIGAVPVPVATREGATYLVYADGLVTLFQLLPGRMLDRENEAECLSAAKMLARLHNAGLAYPDLSKRVNYPPLFELDWENNRLWRWAEVERLLFEQAEPFLAMEPDPAKRACAEQIFARRSLIVQEKEVCRN